MIEGLALLPTWRMVLATATWDGLLNHQTTGSRIVPGVPLLHTWPFLQVMQATLQYLLTDQTVSMLCMLVAINSKCSAQARVFCKKVIIHYSR